MRFPAAFLISLGLHGVLLLLFFTVPGGGPSEPVQIYTVRILESVSRPEARELTLSTQAISALKLESPSLETDAPPLPMPDTPEIPAHELFRPTPRELPSAATTPPPALPQTTPAESPLLSQPPLATAPPTTGPPTTMPPTAQPRALPGLPQALPAPSPAAPTPPPGDSQARTREAPLPPPPGDTVERPTLIERTRGRIQQFNFQVDTAPSAPDLNRAPTPGRERNLLSLRLYSNRVREEVQKSFTFPGAFEAGLRTRVRVLLNRDGEVKSTEIVESSGNDRFDQLVCLAAISRADIPEFPQNIEEDTLTLHFTCSP